VCVPLVVRTHTRKRRVKYECDLIWHVALGEFPDSLKFQHEENNIMRASEQHLRFKCVSSRRHHVFFGRGSKPVLFFILTVLAAAIFTANIYAARSSTNQNFHASEGKIQQNPDSVVAAFDTALNAHDVNTALDLFADNGFVVDHPRETYSDALSTLTGGYGNPTPAATCVLYFGQVACTYSGKSMIGEWLGQLVVENIQVQELGNYQVSGNNVTWKLDISIDGYRRLGIAPLETIAEATVQGGKIQSLTLSLSMESTTRLLTAGVKSNQGQLSVETSGFFLGLISFALILPAGAIYYVSRVKSLFAAIPSLERPWLLLEVGLASLFFGIALILFRDLLGLSPRIWDVLNSTVFVVSTAIFLVAMVLMKRAWTIPSSE